jgi:hypothetical protein
LRNSAYGDLKEKADQLYNSLQEDPTEIIEGKFQKYILI